jgi:tRNA-dihydrouridine synthase
MLEEGSMDAIELSGGLLNNPNIMRSDVGSEDAEAPFQNDARAFKEVLRVPLILVGGIRSYTVAQKLLTEGVADYIAMSRPFICEPDLINRWRDGDLRKAACISCDNCFEQIKKGKGVSCVPLEAASAQSFFPQKSKTVWASPPYPPETGYQISIGLEQWDSNFIPVVKIQMVYRGNILDRSPSFPLGSADHQNVNKAIAELLEEYAAGAATE